MILFKNKPISVPQDNVMTLVCEDENEDPTGFVYVSKHTYNQAVLLEDRFAGDLITLQKQVIFNPTHIQQIAYFFDNAPKPVNVLAPFIGLIQEKVELEDDIEMLCGVLHIISGAINFNEFVKAPLTTRADVSFSKYLLLNYKDAWKEITQTVIESAQSNIQYVQATAHQSNGDTPEDVQTAEDPWAAAMAAMEELMPSTGKVTSELEVESAPTYEPAVEQMSEEDLKAEAEAKRIDDLVKKFGGIK